MDDTIIIVPPPINLALVEIETKIPDIAKWRKVYQKLASAAADVGHHPEAFLDYLLLTEAERQRALQRLTIKEEIVEAVPAQVLSAPEERQLTPAEQVLNVFETAHHMFEPTKGRVKNGERSRRWLTVRQVAELLNLSTSTVQHWAAIYVIEGRLKSRVGEFQAGRRGKRPRLYSLNPQFKETPRGQNRGEDQEASGSR